ncbi:WhiB family transcriptional regulator [Micromonospora sp. NPDC023814]|uniref:WhiB family transcriptional regulator n=1 Tax=Micromonospora sp. NPDC023814 TaxID=3154596 RepID=UPI0033EF36BD
MGWKRLGGVDAGWWERAACAGQDPSWWTERGEHRVEAVRACLSCPVRDECLAEAVAADDVGVIRAGYLLMVKRSRRRLVALVCEQCAVEPVRAMFGPMSRFCGTACATRCGVDLGSTAAVLAVSGAEPMTGRSVG